MPEIELNDLFIKQKVGMSRQAKTAGSSPFWEGVIVLENTDAEAQSANLLEWKTAYEKATGHKVLHMSIHLDEGYMDKDMPVYNPHAHVIVSRMDSKNKVIHLGRKQLAEVQDLTSISLKMERGSTLAERGGKRGRAHLGHREFRQKAEEARLALEADLLKTIKVAGAAQSALQFEISRLETELELALEKPAQQEAEYAAERAAMKASGTAKQAEYTKLREANEKLTEANKLLVIELKALKKAHEATLAELKKANQTINDQAGEIAQLKAKLTQTPAAPAGPRPPVDQSKVRAIQNPGSFDTGGCFTKALEKAARDQSRHWNDIDWVMAEVDAARRLSADSGYQPDYIFNRLVALSPAQQGCAGDVERLRRECRPPRPDDPGEDDDNDYKP